MKRLIVLLVALSLACGQKPVTPPVPPAEPVMTIGQVIQAVHNSIETWGDYASSHRTCGQHVTRGCISKGDTENVATALKEYMRVREVGSDRTTRSSTDATPASDELIQAGAALVLAVNAATKP